MGAREARTGRSWRHRIAPADLISPVPVPARPLSSHRSGAGRPAVLGVCPSTALPGTASLTGSVAPFLLVGVGFALHVCALAGRESQQCASELVVWTIPPPRAFCWLALGALGGEQSAGESLVSCWRWVCPARGRDFTVPCRRVVETHASVPALSRLLPLPAGWGSLLALSLFYGSRG